MSSENGIITCALGAENRARIGHLEGNDERQWDVIDKIRDRLPVWAVFTITGLAGLLSAAVTAFIMTTL